MSSLSFCSFAELKLSPGGRDARHANKTWQNYSVLVVASVIMVVNTHYGGTREELGLTPKNCLSSALPAKSS